MHARLADHVRYPPLCQYCFISRLKMPNSDHNGGVPRFSVIIAVFNDWVPLDACLRSLSEQTNFRDFEVIIVDDGSEHPAPDSIRRWAECYSLSIFREPHAGIAAARNSGVRRSNGEVLVFSDADCRFEPDCLSALNSVVSRCPQYECFQLHLAGDCSTLLGRAEELRLIAIQDQTLQEDGRIRYLNTLDLLYEDLTPAFSKGPFDPAAQRGEDTLLLATLIQRGEIPLFRRMMRRSSIRYLFPCPNASVKMYGRRGFREGLSK